MAVPIDSEMIEKDKGLFSIETKWKAAIVFIVTGSVIPISSHLLGIELNWLSTVIVTSVYLTSLYIAWKKLLTTTAETLFLQTTDLGVKITNLGQNPISVLEVEYIEIKRDKEDNYKVSKKFVDIGEILDSGDETDINFDRHTELVAIQNICYINHLGEKKFKDERLHYNNLSEFTEQNYDTIISIVYNYEKNPPNTMSRMKAAEYEETGVARFDKEEIRRKKGSEILNEYFETDSYEEPEGIHIVPNSGGIKWE